MKMIKLFFLCLSLGLCSFTHQKPAHEKEMTFCESVQFIVKEMINGREQTSLKGSKTEVPNIWNSKFTIKGWKNGVSNGPEQFSFIFYNEDASEGLIRAKFNEVKMMVKNCALSADELPVTNNTTDRFTCTIGAISLDVIFFPKGPEFEKYNVVFTVSMPKS